MKQIDENTVFIGNVEPESKLPEENFWIEYTTWDDQSKGRRRFVRGPKKIDNYTGEDE